MTEFRDPTEYEKAILSGLQMQPHIYGGTVPVGVVADRRRKNKTARKVAAHQPDRGQAMTPQTFRKKPVEIQAMQWDGTRESIERACEWVMSFDDPMGDITLTFEFRGPDDVVGNPVIGTLEGDMQVSPQDWIIRGVQGEFYPCKPDIFAATYDEVVPDGE